MKIPKSFLYFVLFILLLFVFWGMSDKIGIFSCEDEISQTVLSPSGQFEVIIYFRDCGATTSVSTHVGIEEKNLFSAPKDVLIIDGRVEVNAEWREDKVLFINGKGLSKSNDDVYLFDGDFRDIKIKYE